MAMTIVMLVITVRPQLLCRSLGTKEDDHFLTENAGPCAAITAATERSLRSCCHEGRKHSQGSKERKTPSGILHEIGGGRRRHRRLCGGVRGGAHRSRGLGERGLGGGGDAAERARLRRGSGVRSRAARLAHRGRGGGSGGRRDEELRAST